MSQQILQVDQAMLETTLDRMVRKSVEETLNAMLDAEADEITGAARYERSGERKAYRAGHYERDLTVKAGKMSLKVPKLKGAVFESAVIERYRRLAMFMVLAAALLSTFLTNVVALFIVVPLTITLKRLCEIPVNRLIIFEALAVNAGSLLTPIGNPQNILIWGRSGLSFAGFIAQMAPLAGAMMLTLLLLCWCCFPGKALQYHTGVQTPEWKPRLVWSCLGLYIVFLTALELKQELWGLVIVAAGFALLARRVVLSVDWTLLLVFMAMFIDVHLLTQLPALQGVLSNVSHLSEPGLWLTAIGLSQVISNVPSTILLLNYVPPSLLLAWAVNVGGFGLLPGSLANLIALRMANDRRIWWRFHLYSIPMLLWAALVGYVLFVMLPAN